MAGSPWSLCPAQELTDAVRPPFGNQMTPRNRGPDPHVGLSTYLVGGLVKDGVVVINVYNFQVDRDLGCPGWGPVV